MQWEGKESRFFPSPHAYQATQLWMICARYPFTGFTHTFVPCAAATSVQTECWNNTRAFRPHWSQVKQWFLFKQSSVLGNRYKFFIHLQPLSEISALVCSGTHFQGTVSRGSKCKSHRWCCVPIDNSPWASGILLRYEQGKKRHTIKSLSLNFCPWVMTAREPCFKAETKETSNPEGSLFVPNPYWHILIFLNPENCENRGIYEHFTISTSRMLRIISEADIPEPLVLFVYMI